MVAGLIIFFVTVLVFGLSQMFANAAVSYTIAQRYMGRESGIKETLVQTNKRFGAILMAGLLISLGVMLGLICLIIPGIYLIFAWCISTPVIMFEGASGSGSLGRSHRLMKGEKGKAFVVYFLLGLINSGIGAMVKLVPNAYAEALLTCAVNVVLIAFGAVVVTVFYFSARCKAENFDLELLTASLEQQGQSQESVL